MLADLSLLLADLFETLSASYWFFLIVGGGMILISTLSGGSSSDASLDAPADADFGGASLGEADVGVDAGADVDADVGADVHAGHGLEAVHAVKGGALSLSKWFSLRFLIYAMASFGAVGAILSNVTDLAPPAVAASALLAGLVVGQGVHQILRAVRRTSGDSTPQANEYVNKLARVTIPIESAGRGEISLVVRASTRYVPAVSAQGPRSFAAGEEVVVVAYRGGVAEVVTRDQAT